MIAWKLLHLALALLAAPFLLSVINRTKAAVSGRVGQPWLQPYHDLIKLLGKGAVYSRTTTWIFRAGPMVSLAALLTALTLLPFGGSAAAVAFDGDLVLFVYLLGLARLFTVLAALDTGSAFEGMGTSREVLFSALAEPALMLGLAALARETKVLSLTGIHENINLAIWARAGITLGLVAAALAVVLVAENCRIPVDDPTTHLELTMIHEVMVLDHGGPDLAYILYAQALKLWLLGALLLGLVLPLPAPAGGQFGWSALMTGLGLLAMLGLAVLIGAVESSMARLRMRRVPQLLVGAAALSALALILERPGVTP